MSAEESSNLSNITLHLDGDEAQTTPPAAHDATLAEAAINAIAEPNGQKEEKEGESGLGQKTVGEDYQTLWWTDLVVKHHCALLWGIVVVFSILAFAIAGVWEISETSNTDYWIRNDDKARNALLQMEAVDLLTSGGDEEFPLRSNEEGRWMFFLMFKARDGGDLLDVEHLLEIERIENYLMNVPRYDEICYAGEYAPDCAPYARSSVLNGVYDLSNGTETTLQSIQDTTAFIASQNESSALGFYGANFGEDQLTSTYLRSFWIFGTPIGSGAMNTTRKYLNGDDDFADQEAVYVEWLNDVLVFLEDQEKNNELVDVKFVGQLVWDYYFNDVLFSDLTWALGSMFFVWVYMSIHTGSPFLACMGLLGILFAFPLAYAIYWYIFSVQFFQFLHMLIIFVILGIGADDVFVFVDAFKQIPIEYPEARTNLVLHMDLTFRRAVKAMLVTSCTTCAAFSATIPSRLMPISSFGIFAAMLVLCNYFFVITLFPCCIVIWHKYFKGACWCKRQTTWCCLSCAWPIDGADAADKPADVELDDVSNTVADNDDATESAVHAWGKMELFFYDTWAPRIGQLKHVILFVFFGWFIAAVVFAVNIGPLTETENYLPEDHIITIASQWLENSFIKSESDFTTQVSLVWGLDSLNQKNMAFYDALDFGVVVFDDSFDLSPLENQQSLVDSCEELRQNPEALNGIVRCFIDDYALYRTDNNLTFPADFSTDPIVQREMFDADLLNWSENTTAGVGYALASDVNFADSGKLKFIRLEVPTSLPLVAPGDVKEPKFNLWEAQIASLNSNHGAGLNKGYQTAGLSWAWMASEAAFVTGAVQGMAIAASFAFVALLISTTNIVIAIYSTINIAGIVVSVAGCVYIMGWKMGVTESVSLVILVGFSVDYVVHLANSYVESHATTRYLKMREGLREMGATVTAGATTSFGSSLFLWPCVTVFFNKFAALMGLTVGFSILWSIVFFPALLMVGGPENNYGDLMPYVTKCVSLIKGEDSSEKPAVDAAEKK